MSIASEKREIRQNSGSLPWLLFTYGSYYNEEVGLIKMGERYSYRTELGKALVKRKRIVNELRKYIELHIEKRKVEKRQ